jgi:hypothetical protein
MKGMDDAVAVSLLIFYLCSHLLMVKRVHNQSYKWHRSVVIKREIRLRYREMVLQSKGKIWCEKARLGRERNCYAEKVDAETANDERRC